MEYHRPCWENAVAIHFFPSYTRKYRFPGARCSTWADDNATDKNERASVPARASSLALTRVRVFFSSSVHRKQPEKNRMELVYAGLDRMRQLSCN